MKLSTKQNQVVESTEKYMCVVAGAGSGKTRTLTERIKKLISSNKRGERVLAITFSNKAANELKERLLQSFSQNELNDLVYVGTIHNFCMDIVSQRATAIDLPSDLHIFESFEDRFEIFVAALIGIPQLKDKYVDFKGKLNKKDVKELFDMFSKAKRDLKFPEDYTSKPLIQRLYQDYNDSMLAQNAIDFDDILLYAYKIMLEKPAIARIYQRIYKHICVDEAQDLNKAQYSVIKAIAGDSATLFMVGDPNQSIYGFNGSSPEYMLSWFIEDFSAVQYNMNENFRSSKTVIDVAKIIEPTFKMEGILPIIGEVEIHDFVDEAEEAAWVLKKITSLLTEGHQDIEDNICTPEQCIILARNRYVFNTLENMFKENNIEYNLRISANKDLLSESSFFKIFDLGLKLIMNPFDILHFEEMKNIMGFPSSMFVDFATLRASTEFENYFNKKGSEALKCAWDSVISSKQSFRFDKVIEILNNYFSESDIEIGENELEMLFNDCTAWKERWLIYTKNSSIEERSLAHMMRSIALGVTNLSNETGITMSTVHMSKGLEFDVVFIIGLNEGVFPDYRALNNSSQLAEEQHNMFVSITRSKRLCYLSYPLKRMMPWGDVKLQSPSQYVKKIIDAIPAIFHKRLQK